MPQIVGQHTERSIRATPVPPDRFEGPARVLVVNGDARAGARLVEMLCNHNIHAEAAAVTTLRDHAGARQCDLVILDMMICEDGGLAILRTLTQRRHSPGVIMLSHQASEVDRIVALEMGADDCVPKPTSPREMLARVRSVLRRRGRPSPTAGDERGGAMIPAAAEIDVARFAGWTFDVRMRSLLSPAGVVVPLTNGEYGLLLTFVLQPRTVHSRDRLARASGKRPVGERDRTIDVNVSRLRRKLADHMPDELIRTVRSGGYLFLPAVTCDPLPVKGDPQAR